MIIKKDGLFEARCDVCGVSEAVTADNHSQAWYKIRSWGWTLRKGDPRIIHACPDHRAEKVS